MENNTDQKYALIVGNGRSGTNWLLSMLDASPATHCRNEPHDISDSPFHDLPNPVQMQENPELMAKKWDDFATWTGRHMGERDHRIKAPKTHVHEMSQKLGVAYWPVRPKIRSALKLALPALRHGEWSMPWWIGSQNHLEKSYAVFKINDFRAWYVHWLLENRPQVPIVHLVRHPGGQLNSGINRFFSNLSEKEQEQERQLYTGILQTAIKLKPHWAEILGDPSNMELIEAVAWFWRYNNEEIFRIGKEYANYLFVTYEQVSQDPLSFAKQIYNFCDIPWEESTEASIKAGLSISMWGKLSAKPSEIAETWKTRLSPDYKDLADRVLKDSILEEYWSGEA